MSSWLRLRCMVPHFGHLYFATRAEANSPTRPPHIKAWGNKRSGPTNTMVSATPITAVSALNKTS